MFHTTWSLLQCFFFILSPSLGCSNFHDYSSAKNVMSHLKYKYQALFHKTKQNIALNAMVSPYCTTKNCELCRKPKLFSHNFCFNPILQTYSFPGQKANAFLKFIMR